MTIFVTMHTMYIYIAIWYILRQHDGCLQVLTNTFGTSRLYIFTHTHVYTNTYNEFMNSRVLLKHWALFIIPSSQAYAQHTRLYNNTRQTLCKLTYLLCRGIFCAIYLRLWWFSNYDIFGWCRSLLYEHSFQDC